MTFHTFDMIPWRLARGIMQVINLYSPGMKRKIKKKNKEPQAPIRKCQCSVIQVQQTVCLRDDRQASIYC